MAIGAVLGCSDTAGGVWKVGVERLAAVSFGRKRLLLRIDPFPVRILRAHHPRAGGTDHRHSVLFHRSIDPKHEYVVPDHLRIVGGVIPISNAFEFVLRYSLIGLHRQMTSE